MTAVNVSATFKKDERENNGLESIAKELIDNPMTRHVIVAVVETSSVRTDYAAGGTVTPTVRLVQVEPVEGADADQVRAVLDAAFRKRTGRDENPAATLFDAERTVDPSTQDVDAPAENDPAAGPWPGDTDYPPETAEAAATATAGRRGRRAATRVDGE